MTKLLPCPFCGSEPEVKILLVLQDGSEWKIVIAVCPECTARVEKRLPGSFAAGTLVGKSESYGLNPEIVEMVGEIWNRRTGQQ